MFNGIDLEALGNLGQMQEMFKNLTDNLQDSRIEVSSQDKSIIIVANGKGEIIDLKIDDALLKDKKLLELLLLSTITELFTKLHTASANLAADLFKKST